MRSEQKGRGVSSGAEGETPSRPLLTHTPAGCSKQPQAYLCKACKLTATAHLQLPSAILTPTDIYAEILVGYERCLSH